MPKHKNDDSSGDSGSDEPKPAPKKNKPVPKKSNDDEEPSWPIDKKRFVKVRDYKGKIYVDIREFYDADGDLKPGKKGISLSVPQWKKLVEVTEEVNEAISNMA